MPTRRQMLLALASGVAGVSLRSLGVGAMALPNHPAARHPSRGRPLGKHPEPRPGIDASKVLATSALTEKDAAPAFDDARAIPQILDGIRCHCNCGDTQEKYSLLSCYEREGMAPLCEICQAQARLARRLVRLRRTLAEIRDAIDRRYPA